MDVVDLVINDDFSAIWNRYIYQFSMAGITLNHEYDQLCWHGGLSMENIPVKGIYDFISSSLGRLELKCSFCKIWTWHVTKKIMLFGWIIWRNQVLTWDKLCRCELQGPRRCTLCHGSNENVMHFCFFVIAWIYVLQRI